MDHLKLENIQLKEYIRDKINQMLEIIGTSHIKEEELTDEMLVDLDPIGIISGSFSRILENVRDTNAQLKLARDEIEAILNAAATGIMVINRDRHIVAYNKKQAELFNYPEDTEAIDLCYHITCRKDHKPDVCCIGELFETGKAIHHHQWNVNGRMYNLVAEPIKDESENAILAVISYHDITDRIRNEETLAMERDQLSFILETINDGILTITPGGIITVCNKKSCEILDIPEADLQGQDVVEVLFPGDKRDLPDGVISAGTSPGKRFHAYQGSICRNYHVNDNDITLEIYQVPVYSNEGKLLSAVITLRDITEQRKAEKDQVRKQNLESLSHMAAGIAHDFNNILTAAMSNLSLSRLANEKGEKALEPCNALEENLNHARGLVKQLSTFASGGAPVIEDIALEDLLNRYVTEVFKGSMIKRDINIESRLPRAAVDPRQFGQVLNNILTNARQAMDDQDTLFIRAMAKEIPDDSSSSLQPGTYLSIEIEDTGHGISRQDLPHIFDPFFSTKKNASGIGLTTVESIMRRHGGNISAVSQEGSGTCFTLMVPAADTKEQKNKPAQKSTGKASLKGKRILLMDDDTMILKSTGILLETIGFDVITAEDGDTALNLIKNEREKGTPFHCVIMDLVIPGGRGGVETVGPARELDPGLKIIVSSGYSDEEVMSNYSEYGFHGVAPKPYSLDEITKELSRVLLS